jgi:carbon monoxide dehydrogenase subunit G
MRRNRTLVLVVLAALAAGAAALAAEGKWEKDGTKDGVTVYTRAVEGSEVKEVKSIATINAPTDRVWDHLITSETFVKSMPDVIKSKKIGDCGETCGYWYQVLRHPPIKDRHYVLKVQWEITDNDDGTKSYRRWWKVTTAVKPPASGMLLVEKVSGAWNLKPKDGGKKTLITYRNHIEMGGKVPIMLVNSGALANAYKFLQNLKKDVK